MEMKMSDVFELPVSRDGFKLKDKCGISDEMHVAKFADLSACVYAEFAINNYDRLEKENAELKADRDNAISKMSKSWQHNADDHPDLLSRFVDMANRQFDERDALRESMDDFESVLSRVMLGCSMSNELSDDIEKLLNQIGENE